jgi:hypothetical protein
VFCNRTQPRRDILVVEIAKRGTGGVDAGTDNSSKVARDVHKWLTGGVVLP